MICCFVYIHKEQNYHCKLANILSYYFWLFCLNSRRNLVSAWSFWCLLIPTLQNSKLIYNGN